MTLITAVRRCGVGGLRRRTALTQGYTRSPRSDNGRASQQSWLFWAAPLAALIPGARALDIPGRDHMLAVGDRVYKDGVLEFLKERP